MRVGRSLSYLSERFRAINVQGQECRRNGSGFTMVAILVIGFLLFVAPYFIQTVVGYSGAA